MRLRNLNANSAVAGKKDNTLRTIHRERRGHRKEDPATKDPLCFWSAGLTRWFEDEFLDAPIQEFGDVEFVRGGAGDFVNPAELTKLLAGFAKDAEDFPVEREFVDAAGKSVGSVENLIWRGRDANSPGRAGRHGAGG